jgi:hypothetical protein
MVVYMPVVRSVEEYIIFMTEGGLSTMSVPASVRLLQTDRRPGLPILHSHHNAMSQEFQPYFKFPSLYM